MDSLKILQWDKFSTYFNVKCRIFCHFIIQYNFPIEVLETMTFVAQIFTSIDRILFHLTLYTYFAFIFLLSCSLLDLRHLRPKRDFYSFHILSAYIFFSFLCIRHDN